MNSIRCAACKYLRRRCAKDCIFAPYFPSNNPDRFECVHKIFGASNISKMLQNLPEERRSEAADSMALEAASRVREPVYGAAGIITQLCQQISEVEHELARTQGLIALCKAQYDHQPTFAPSGCSNVLQPSEYSDFDHSSLDVKSIPI